MQCASIKTVAVAIIKYSFLAHMCLINSCNGCDFPSSCLHFLSTRHIDAFTQLPESHEFLKALGLVTGVAVVIVGVKQLQKIIIDIDKKDRKQQQQQDALQLPDTLYARINHRICNLDKKIEQELLERERLLTLQYTEEESTKKITPQGEQISVGEQSYDTMTMHKFACETGCAILNVPRRRKT